jgi:hypothetical protein
MGPEMRQLQRPILLARRVNPPTSAADWVALLPVSVVALGTPAQPVEKLLSVQSAIIRAVNAITYAAARLHRMRSLTAAPTRLPANQLQPIDIRKG